MNIFLGFDFYGAGNIGDDLMLNGFLTGLPDISKNYKIICLLRKQRKINSQQLRFPEIQWIEPNSSESRSALIANSEIWLGVGDTPFQMIAGPWFIDRLIEDLNLALKYKKPAYMLCVGGEREVLSVKDKLVRVLDAVHHIWTRDEFTYDLLTNEINVERNKITVGSDLANVILKNIFLNLEKNCDRKYDLAIDHASSHLLNDSNIRQLRSFLNQISNNKSVLFIANDVRKRIYTEWAYYKRMFLIKELLGLSKIKFYVPEYNNSTINDLVSHYKNYKVVITSRYHGLLSAAWAGCKVAAIARSSKINAFAKELDIPFVSEPFTVSKLYHAYENAKQISNQVLENLVKKSLYCLEDFYHKILSSY